MDESQQQAFEAAREEIGTFNMNTLNWDAYVNGQLKKRDLAYYSAGANCKLQEVHKAIDAMIADQYRILSVGFEDLNKNVCRGKIKMFQRLKATIGGASE